MHLTFNMKCILSSNICWCWNASQHNLRQRWSEMDQVANALTETSEGGKTKSQLFQSFCKDRLLWYKWEKQLGSVQREAAAKRHLSSSSVGDRLLHRAERTKRDWWSRITLIYGTSQRYRRKAGLLRDLWMSSDWILHPGFLLFPSSVFGKWNVMERSSAPPSLTTKYNVRLSLFRSVSSTLLPSFSFYHHMWPTHRVTLATVSFVVLYCFISRKYH